MVRDRIVEACRDGLDNGAGGHDGLPMGIDYHLKPGYEERLDPDYWLDESTEVVWQPDVYREATDLAERIGARLLIDIGCGNGEKLAPYRDQYDIIGIDFGANIESCIARYDWGEWIVADLDADAEPLPVGAVADSVVVCADVIEHVIHPERLLRKLRDLLDRGALALVLTTPDRELRRGLQHTGPSPNRAHVREWALTELERFMGDEGLAGMFGLTRTNDREPFLHTIFSVVPGPRLATRQAALEHWWAYREHWQEIALAHEALLVESQSHLVLRAGRRVRRGLRTFRRETRR